MTQAIADMDHDMGYLLSELERVGLKVSTNLIIVSDHGMAAPSEEKFVLLDKIIDLDDVRVVGWGPVSIDSSRRRQTGWSV